MAHPNLIAARRNLRWALMNQGITEDEATDQAAAIERAKCGGMRDEERANTLRVEAAPYGDM